MGTMSWGLHCELWDGPSVGTAWLVGLGAVSGSLGEVPGLGEAWEGNMRDPSGAIWLCSQLPCRVVQGPRTQPQGQCWIHVLGARALNPLSHYGWCWGHT